MTTLRPLSVDDLSTARYIHAASFSASAPEHYAQADIDAFNAFVRSPRYADLLLGNNAVAAWIDSEMVGTAAWSPGEGRSPTARIIVVAVRPLFTGEGIGRLLIDHVEAQARAAGYQALEVSATLNAVGFFEGLGFRIVRNGGWALPLGHEIPVAFMRKADFVGLHAVR
ncbi:MAG TPA: GNAT family N-acetyltransferase [Hyphomicrobium sp.]|jgi:putative acetyltransferase